VAHLRIRAIVGVFYLDCIEIFKIAIKVSYKSAYLLCNMELHSASYKHNGSLYLLTEQTHHPHYLVNILCVFIPATIAKL
jgi:hypothetical protein